MRKATRSIELEDIISTNFFGDNDMIIGVVLRSHLALEACIVELVQINKSDDAIWKKSFPHKTFYLVSNGHIGQSDKEAFDLYNDFRNDFAHIFDHKVGLEDVLALAVKLEKLGVDFSDSVGHYTPMEATEYYGGIEGVMAEIAWCILFHASYLLLKNGGRDIFAAK